MDSRVRDSGSELCADFVGEGSFLPLLGFLSFYTLPVSGVSAHVQ